MKILYAPWRQSYSTRLKKEKLNPHSYTCPFCVQSQENFDEAHFIIKRYKYNYLCMNKHPYNAGHLLVIPYEHQGDLTLFPIDTLTELMQITQEALFALRTICNTSAFNTGLNMGKEAGGSIPDHLHMHILPRFGSDTGFLSVLAHTKVISTDIMQVYRQLKKLLNEPHNTLK